MSTSFCSFTNTAIANFSDKQGGFSVGGKLLANRAFFFGNADLGRKKTPTGFCIEGCGQPFRGSAADVDRFLSILQTKYGYSVPDAKSEFTRTTDSDKALGKVDFKDLFVVLKDPGGAVVIASQFVAENSELEA